MPSIAFSTKTCLLVPLASTLLLLAACQKTASPGLPDVNGKTTPPAATTVMADGSKPAAQTESPTASTTVEPRQAFEQTVDCAALLAVHESAVNGEMKSGSATFDLVTYALGKAQEYALQARMEAGLAKTRYGELTLGYFSRQEADRAAFLEQTRDQVSQCGQLLRQYEPQAQIQDAIRAAVEKHQQSN